MNRKNVEGIARGSGHGLQTGNEPRYSRHLTPSVIGVCFVVVLASSLALVLVPGARASPTPANSTTPRVPCGASIQGAINAAHPGETIALAPCTYVQQLTIDKSVNILGAGAGKTIIQSPTTLKPDAFGNPWTIELGNAATVTLSGFTLVVTLQCIISSPYAANGFQRGYAGGGIGVGGGAFLNLQSAAVTTIGAAEGASCDVGAGFLSYGTGVAFGLDYVVGSPPAPGLVGLGAVSGVTISGFGFGGASVSVGGGVDSPAGSYALISNTEVIAGADDCGPAAGWGPAISVGQGANASSATIVDNTLTGLPGSCNTGVIVGYGSSAYIAHNTIRVQPYGSGILVGDSGSATILYNSILGSTTDLSGSGIELYDGTATIAFNVIGDSECEYNATWVAEGLCGPSFANQYQVAGIMDLFDPGLGTMIENNLVFNTDIGVELYGGCAGCVVRGNTLVNSIDYGLEGADGSYAFLQNWVVGGSYGVAAIAFTVNTTVTLSHVVMVGQSIAPFYYENDCLSLWGYSCTDTIVGT
jgi:parallel beta-helix repeat protein